MTTVAFDGNKLGTPYRSDAFHNGNTANQWSTGSWWSHQHDRDNGLRG